MKTWSGIALLSVVALAGACGDAAQKERSDAEIALLRAERDQALDRAKKAETELALMRDSRRAHAREPARDAAAAVEAPVADAKPAAPAAAVAPLSEAQQAERHAQLSSRLKLARTEVAAALDAKDGKRAV